MLMRLGQGMGKGSERAASVPPYLDGVLDSVCCDLDATVAASYPGTGQTWANLIAAPADGSAQTAYDFWLGTGSNTTSDPSFIGVAGDIGACFLVDASGEGFRTVAASVAAQPDLLLDAHKVTNVAGVTFGVRMIMPSSVTGFGGNIFGNENTSTKNGFRLYYNHSNARFELRIWRNPSASVSFNFTTLSMTVDKEYMLFVTLKGNGATQTTARMYLHNITDGTTATESLTASNNDTVDATGFMAWGNDDSFGDALINARYKWFGIFNRELAQGETDDVRDHLLAR